MLDISFNDLPPFYHQLKGKSVVIIGNGPSATSQPLGHSIDGFDCIIRINNYVTAGMEDQVGSRTDIWVNGANQGLHRRKEQPENILVMIPPVVLQHKGDAIHARVEKRLGTTNYFLLPLDVMTQMESSSGIPRPTTGFFSIYFFYQMGCDVTLHGFDFFVNSKAHYFDSPIKRWLKDRGLIPKAGKHDVSQEKLLVETLIESGKISLLKS